MYRVRAEISGELLGLTGKQEEWGLEREKLTARLAYAEEQGLAFEEAQHASPGRSRERKL